MSAGFGPHRPPEPDDRGAVAVEFALLLPLLMMFLFGVIQYGYGLYQVQSLTSVVGDATQEAATGIDDCDRFTTGLTRSLGGGGLDRDGLRRIEVNWLTADGQPSSTPSRLGQVKVTLTYRPFKLGIPFLPFPDLITRSQTAAVQDVTGPDLSGCLLERGPAR